MSRKFRLPIIIGSVITIIVLAAVLGSIALAQDDVPQGSTAGEGQVSSEVAVPVPGGPGFVSLSAVAFTNYSAAASYAFNGQTLYNPGAGTAVYEGSLNLPQGATITKFVAYYYDNNATYDLTAILAEGPFDTTFGNAIAVTSSTGTGAGYRYGEDTTITSPDVDNSSNSYWVELLLPPAGDVRLVAVRVDYAFPTGLPLIEK